MLPVSLGSEDLESLVVLLKLAKPQDGQKGQLGGCTLVKRTVKNRPNYVPLKRRWLSVNKSDPLE